MKFNLDFKTRTVSLTHLPYESSFIPISILDFLYDAIDCRSADFESKTAFNYILAIFYYALLTLPSDQRASSLTSKHLPFSSS